MTHEDIVRMFNEAGATAGWKPGFGNPLVLNYLSNFAVLVAAAEREACASECDAVAREYQCLRFTDAETAADNCAGAIRARKDTE